MATKTLKKIILVQKVDYQSYKELEKSNILPLVIDAKGSDLSPTKEYAKLDEESNLYVLKIQYLKWHNFELLRQSEESIPERDSLLFADGNSVDIIRPVEKFECEAKEEGFLTQSIVGSTFISKKELIAKALGEKKEDRKIQTGKEAEKVTITSQIVSTHDYSMIREHHFLPFLVVLTDFEYRVMAKPFEGLYSKLRTNEDGKVIMVINPSCLQTQVDRKNIELNGIELLNKETVSINGIWCGNLEEDLGGFYIHEDEYLSVEEYSSNIMETNKNKMTNDSSESGVKKQLVGYWY